MLDKGKEYNKIKNFKKEVALPAIARTHAYLRSFNGNPIIQPTTNSWESFATFNPATVCESGKVHLGLGLCFWILMIQQMFYTEPKSQFLSQRKMMTT